MTTLLDKIKSNKRLIIITSIYLIILLLLEWLFFRNVIGTDSLIGDNGDGRLTMLLNEHWFRFFSGKESFRELLQFSPLNSTLGYTDIFLGTGIFYSVLRVLSVNMYNAYKIVILLFHLFGTITMYILLKKTFKICHIWAFIGTIIFSFSATFFNSLCHTQIIVLSCLPLLMIFISSFIKNFNIRKKRNIYFTLFVFQFSFIAYTAWYIAYFTYLFIIILLIVFIIKIFISKIKIFKKIIVIFKTIGFDLIWYFILIICLIAPFAYIYITALKSSKGDFGQYPFLIFTIDFIDLFNLGKDNLMLGWLFKPDWFNRSQVNADFVYGYSIILIFTFIFLSIMYIMNKKKIMLLEKFLISSIIISIIVSLILIMRLSSNGFSLWILVYYVIPFSNSIRAVARFMLWLLFPISIIISYLGNRFYPCSVSNFSKINRKQNNEFLNKIIISAFACFLIVSNISKIGVNSNWTKTDDIAFLNTVPEPKNSIKYFFIVDSSKKHTNLALYQLDAFAIANKYNIKTLNGYSGLFPNEWDLWDIHSDNYIPNVKNWINKYHLENVYMYDEGSCSWSNTF